MGDPVKFNFHRQDRYLRALQRGLRRSQAARLVGMTPSGINTHARKHPSFAREVDAAECYADDQIEGALFNSAKRGNVTAQQVWLYNRRPESWRDMRSFKHIFDQPEMQDLANLSTDELLGLEHMHARINGEAEETATNGNGSSNGSNGNGSAPGGSPAVH